MMVSRVDRPYWFSWLAWHLHQRHRRHKAAQRRAVWRFVNHIRSMPAGSLVIDGGANVGRVTAAFVRHGFEVHAFEPDPVAFAVLKGCYSNHPLVHLHCAAVGARTGTMTLYRTKEFAHRPVKATTSSSLIPREAHDSANAAEVKVVDLIAFMQTLGRRVDLLKLDIEGSEVPLLERILDEGVHKEIGAIFVETHERHSADLAERTAAIRKRTIEGGYGNIELHWR